MTLPISKKYGIVVRDGTRKIDIEKLFMQAERILSKRYDYYKKNLVPMAILYCGPTNTINTTFFLVGIIVGMIIERKGYTIEVTDTSNAFIYAMAHVYQDYIRKFK